METIPAHCDRTREAAPYVLGELKGYDLDAFARHLQTCDACAEEVDLLEVAAHAVPLLAAQHAKSPEQATEDREHAHERPRLRAIPGGFATAPAVSPALSHRPHVQTRRRLLRQPVPKPAVIAFALLAVIGAFTIALSNRSASIRYLHVRAGWSTGGGAAIKLEGDQAEVLVDGMPLPASGTGYQVWVVSRATKRLTPTDAWLHPDRKGEAGADVPGDYHDLDAIAVYVEPLKGAHTTRSGAVVVADLRQVH